MPILYVCRLGNFVRNFLGQTLTQGETLGGSYLAESVEAGRFVSDCRQIIQLSFVKITDGYLSDINNLKIGFYEPVQPVRNVYLTATGGCYSSVSSPFLYIDILYYIISCLSLYCEKNVSMYKHVHHPHRAHLEAPAAPPDINFSIISLQFGAREML